MGNPLSGGWGPQLTLGMCWKGQLLRPQGRAAAALTWQGRLPPLWLEVQVGQLAQQGNAVGP